MPTDVDGCAGSNPCGEPRDVCTDVPAPGTGFTCGCVTGLAWDGAACVACVSVIAGVTGEIGCSGEGLANESRLNGPTSVSVDAAGNVYIAGEPGKAAMHPYASVVWDCSSGSSRTHRRLGKAAQANRNSIMHVA